MSSKPKNYLSCCLFFTANALSRVITRMAEEEFYQLRMSPSHAFMLMLVVEQPGITQKELAGHLHLAQSTVSRFADKLVQLKYTRKKVSGKTVQVFPTDDGKCQMELISTSWNNLLKRYSSVLGEEEAKKLTVDTFQAHLEIEKSFLPET